MLISGLYYCALAAGIVSKGAPAVYEQASTVVAKLRELAASTKEGAAKDVANATRLLVVLEKLFGDTLGNVQCCFARDWKIDGADFRTTWTAGWWLEQLDVEPNKTTLPPAGAALASEE